MRNLRDAKIHLLTALVSSVLSIGTGTICLWAVYGGPVWTRAVFTVIAIGGFWWNITRGYHAIKGLIAFRAMIQVANKMADDLEQAIKAQKNVPPPPEATRYVVPGPMTMQ